MPKSELIPIPVKVLNVQIESSDTYSYWLKTKIPYQPGQFIQVSLLGIGEAPISISSYTKGKLQITVRSIGKVTNSLKKIKKGDTLFIRGPYGIGYPMTDYENKDLILIGGGCGIAPLKGVIDYVEHHRDKYNEVFLFLGYRSPKDILFKKELKLWRKLYNIQVTVEDIPDKVCYTGTVGYVTKSLRAFSISDPKNYMICLCGPPIMMTNCAQILTDKKISPEQIYISAERLMYCGVGQCCHCMIKGKFVCTDGPVFKYSEIILN